MENPIPEEDGYNSVRLISDIFILILTRLIEMAILSSRVRRPYTVKYTLFVEGLKITPSSLVKTWSGRTYRSVFEEPPFLGG